MSLLHAVGGAVALAGKGIDLFRDHRNKKKERGCDRGRMGSRDSDRGRVGRDAYGAEVGRDGGRHGDRSNGRDYGEHQDHRDYRIDPPPRYSWIDSSRSRSGRDDGTTRYEANSGSRTYVWDGSREYGHGSANPSERNGQERIDSRDNDGHRNQDEKTQPPTRYVDERPQTAYVDNAGGGGGARYEDEQKQRILNSVRYVVPTRACSDDLILVVAMSQYSKYLCTKYH